jgi:hypothetical protein
LSVFCQIHLMQTLPYRLPCLWHLLEIFIMG